MKLLSACLVWLVAFAAQGGQLVSIPLSFSEHDTNVSAPADLTAVITNTATFLTNTAEAWRGYLDDNDTETATQLGVHSSLMVDLGQTAAVHRVYFAGDSPKLQVWPGYSSATQNNPPLGLVNIYAGETSETTNRVGYTTIPYDAGNPVNTEFDIRFSPVSARYIRIEVETNVTWGTSIWPGFATTNVSPGVTEQWTVSEVEVFGNEGSYTNNDAVVLASGAAELLSIAASDLSYYLSELSGAPVPIIAPAQTNDYPGTLYTIVDLASLAPDYTTMTNNLASGAIPTNQVNITQDGRVVSFSGWPYRAVAWSVWEFLERQGVRWVYPDSHSDIVQSGAGVDMSMLPLEVSPSAKSIFANFPIGAFRPWVSGVTQSRMQGSLYFWRNRWNCSWSEGEFSTAEVPKQAATGIPLDSQYSEGFSGYPHNMNNVMPNRILATNSAWWGTLDGVNYTNVGVQFQLASDGAVEWLSGKLTNYAASYPLDTSVPLTLLPYRRSWNFLPIDAVKFSVGAEMEAAETAYGGETNVIPWIGGAGSTFSSGSYYKLLATVASNAPSLTVGGLAYADVFNAPRSNYPSNVRMDVTLWGSPNLSLEAAPNAMMWSALTNWQRACDTRGYYDYALLFVDYWNTNAWTPVPMVASLVTNYGLLKSLDMYDGGSQAFVGASGVVPYSTIQYNPWNFYAYPRIRWNGTNTADNLLDEFFTGYYQEASGPMRSYYDAMAAWHTDNAIDLHNLLGFCYWVSPGAFPRSLLYQMQTNLAAAQSIATNWYTRIRVNDATNSWWYCVTNQGITDLSSLTNFGSLVSVPDSGPFSVSLEDSVKYYPTRSISGYYYTPSYYSVTQLQFNGAAIAAQTLNITNAGDYLVTIVSSCPDTSNGWPDQKVWMGPDTSGKISITSTNDTTNSFLATLPASANDLVIAETKSGAYLRVKSVTIEKQ